MKKWLKRCWECEHYYTKNLRRDTWWGGWKLRGVYVCGIIAEKKPPIYISMVADKRFQVPHECPYRLEIMMRNEKSK